MTGALVVDGGCFAQALEGPREAVERTFERIQRDARHSDVVVLQLAAVGRRGFPAWSMAFVGRWPRAGRRTAASPARAGSWSPPC